MLDPKPFLAHVEQQTGQTVRAFCETRRKVGDAIIGKAGLLCALDDGLAFVEDAILEPGEVTLTARDQIEAAELDRGVLDSTLVVQTDDGPVYFENLAHDQAMRVALAANLPLGGDAAVEPPSSGARAGSDEGSLGAPTDAGALAGPAEAASARSLELWEDDELAAGLALAQAADEDDADVAALRAAVHAEDDDAAEADETARAMRAAAAGLELPAELEIRWKRSTFEVSSPEFLDGIRKGRFGRATRFRTAGTTEPYQRLGDSDLYEQLRPARPRRGAREPELRRKATAAAKATAANGVKAAKADMGPYGWVSYLVAVVVASAGLLYHWSVAVLGLFVGYTAGTYVAEQLNRRRPER